MQILFITNNFPPIIDGVGDYTYNIAKQFAEQNHKVYIVCKQSPLIDMGISKMTVLPIIKKWDLNCYKPIIKLIKEKSIDVVSLQYVPHGFHTLGLPFPIIKVTKEIKRCNVKLFTFFHEVSIEKERGNLKRTILSIIMQYISTKIIENSDEVATSIEYYKRMISKLDFYKRDIPLIPIASNIPETTLSNNEIKFLKKKLTPNEEKIISFFGIRNIQTSIDAINNLKNEGYKIRILIIGKTSKILPHNLPQDTIKTGLLEIDKIDKFFKISDIFILPQDNIYGCSFKSGSFAAGLRNRLPIISAQGKITSEQLKNEENIIFTDFNDSRKIKEAIRFLLDNPIIAKEIGDAAYRTAKEFTWHNTYLKYISIIKK